MKPSNPKYTLQEVGLTEPKPIKTDWFDMLFVPNMADFAEWYNNYRQHLIFARLNPEE